MGSIIQSVGTRRWTSQAPSNSRQKQCKRCRAPPLFLDGSRQVPFRSLRLEAIPKRLGTGQAEIALIRFIKEPSTVCCPSTRITNEKF